MVKFNEIKIFNKAGVPTLGIDVEVLSVKDSTGKDLFANVYISRVIVIKASDYNSNLNPATSTTVTYVWDSNDYTNVTALLPAKHLNVEIGSADFKSGDIATDMFMVYVYTTGAPDEKVCCQLTKSYDIGVVFNTCRVYNQLMQGLGELNNNCDIPVNLVNTYLNYMAIKYAVKTCNYTDAINRYYKIFNTNNVRISSGSGCGCNK